MTRSVNYALAVALAAGLGGCAVMPAELQGDYSQTSPSTQLAAGTAVRWGGRFIGTANLPDETCFEILSKELDTSTGRPRSIQDHQGRFLACQSGFVDPETHEQGQDVTVTGRLTGQMGRPIGDHTLMEPRVDITGIHWWQPRVYPYDGPYGPYGYGPYGYGPWGSPFWGPRFGDPFFYGGGFYHGGYYRGGGYHGGGNWNHGGGMNHGGMGGHGTPGNGNPHH